MDDGDDDDTDDDDTDDDTDDDHDDDDTDDDNDHKNDSYTAAGAAPCSLLINVDTIHQLCYHIDIVSIYLNQYLNW